MPSFLPQAPIAHAMTLRLYRRVRDLHEWFDTARLDNRLLIAALSVRARIHARRIFTASAHRLRLDSLGWAHLHERHDTRCRHSVLYSATIARCHKAPVANFCVSTELVFNSSTKGAIPLAFAMASLFFTRAASCHNALAAARCASGDSEESIATRGGTPSAATILTLFSPIRARSARTAAETH